MSDTNDWLLYNASEYTVNGVTYRNLEAQVLKNKEDIEAIDVSQLESDVEQLQLDVAGKQDTLTAGSNISIVGDTISATDTTYTAGTGITILNGVISTDTNTMIVGGVIATSGTTATITLGDDLTVSDLLNSTKATLLYLNNYDITSGVDFNVLINLNVDDVTASTMRIDGIALVNGKVLRISGTYNNDATTITGTYDAEYHSETVILYANDWVLGSGGTFNTQDVYTVDTTLSASSLVWVSPAGAEADVTNYAENKIYCAAQGSGVLTFNTIGTSSITDNINVNVVWKN